MTGADLQRLADLRERFAAEAAEHRLVTSTLGSQVYCAACGHGGCEDITAGALTDEEFAELAKLETAQRRRAAALQYRCQRYAVKFAIDSGGEPTAANLGEILSRCVRAPRPGEYPAIAEAVRAYRAGMIEGTKPYRARERARMIGAALTYDEAIQLAAALYGGMRLAEMALSGDLGMTRVASADRAATVAMIAELKAEQRALQTITRRGRQPVPNPYV